VFATAFVEEKIIILNLMADNSVAAGIDTGGTNTVFGFVDGGAFTHTGRMPGYRPADVVGQGI
jgi:hypothetical protein